MEQESVSSLRGVADDEVIQSHTCIFWIATKIFDFLAMTSVCVILNKNCHPEKTKKQAVKRRSSG